MDIKLKLDSSRILHKEFTGTKPGYDALQVDTFLDLVIEDYKQMEGYLHSSKKEREELLEQDRLLKKENERLRLENTSLNARLKGISATGDASLSNLEYLKRIAALEKALSKAGINPNDIS